MKYIVLGEHLNALAVGRELYETGVEVYISNDRSICIPRFSRYFRKSLPLENNGRLFNEICQGDVTRVIITDDKYFTQIVDDPSFYEHFSGLYQFCKNRLPYLDKTVQYNLAELNDIATPRSNSCLTAPMAKDFPVIVKPIDRTASIKMKFKVKVCVNADAYNVFMSRLAKKDLCVWSQLVQADDSMVYSLSVWKSDLTTVASFWTGRKLTQFPDNYGVAGAAEICTIEEAQLTKMIKFMEAIPLGGFLQAEFKKGQDDIFYLMEVNLRPMLWNHVSFLNFGSSLSNGERLQEQDGPNTILKNYLHDFSNLISGHISFRKFVYLFNRKGKDILLDWSDPMPILASVPYWIKYFIRAIKIRIGKSK